MIADPVALLPNLNVSRETHEALLSYMELVKKWNPAINLVSKADLANLWNRHMLDSVQLFRQFDPSWRLWCDIGSGGGFPGLVGAIIAAEKCPDLTFTLIESDKRKAVFLRHVSQALGLSVQVIADRIDMVPAVRADVLSARALAPLDTLCGLAFQHLKPDGMAMFPKGTGAATEVALARQSWNFNLTTLPSVTDPDASILVLKELAHV